MAATRSRERVAPYSISVTGSLDTLALAADHHFFLLYREFSAYILALSFSHNL